MSPPPIASPPVDDSPIRITAVETTVVNAEMRNWILVKVRTDQDGLHGWGEASLNWKTRAVRRGDRRPHPHVVGRDPRDIEQIVRVLTKHSYYRLGIIGATAISGIEHALWDIFGKSVGQPVWRLLGGRVRDRCTSTPISASATCARCTTPVTPGWCARRRPQSSSRATTR